MSSMYPVAEGEDQSQRSQHLWSHDMTKESGQLAKQVSSLCCLWPNVGILELDPGCLAQGQRCVLT